VCLRKREHVRIRVRADVRAGLAGPTALGCRRPSRERRRSASPCRSLNGCGLNRDTKSIEFLRLPGIEKLYSGLASQMHRSPRPDRAVLPRRPGSPAPSDRPRHRRARRSRPAPGDRPPAIGGDRVGGQSGEAAVQRAGTQGCREDQKSDGFTSLVHSTRPPVAFAHSQRAVV
jgi:hypothetical protein